MIPLNPSSNGISQNVRPPDRQVEPNHANVEFMPKASNVNPVNFWLELIKNGRPALEDIGANAILTIQDELVRDLESCQKWENSPIRCFDHFQRSTKPFTFILSHKDHLGAETCVGLRLSIEGNMMRCRVMDKTLGTLVAMSGEALKGAYRTPDLSIPMKASKSQWSSFESRGSFFFQTLQELQKHPEFKKMLLNLLGSFGKPDSSDPILKLQPTMITSRHTFGSQKEQIIRLFLRDHLIAAGCSKEEIDRSLWQVRFLAVSKNENASEEDIRSFGLYSTKLYESGIISDADLQRLTPMTERLNKPIMENPGVALPAQLRVEASLPCPEIQFKQRIIDEQGEVSQKTIPVIPRPSLDPLKIQLPQKWNEYNELEMLFQDYKTKKQEARTALQDSLKPIKESTNNVRERYSEGYRPWYGGDEWTKSKAEHSKKFLLFCTKRDEARLAWQKLQEKKATLPPDTVHETLVEMKIYCEKQLKEGNYLEVLHAVDDTFKNMPALANPIWDRIPETDLSLYSGPLRSLVLLGLKGGQLAQHQGDYSFNQGRILDRGYALISRLVQRASDLDHIEIHDPLHGSEHQTLLLFQGDEARAFNEVRTFFKNSSPAESGLSRGLKMDSEIALSKRLFPERFNLEEIQLVNKHKLNLETNEGKRAKAHWEGIFPVQCYREYDHRDFTNFVNELFGQVDRDPKPSWYSWDDTSATFNLYHDFRLLDLLSRQDWNGLDFGNLSIQQEKNGRLTLTSNGKESDHIISEAPSKAYQTGTRLSPVKDPAIQQIRGFHPDEKNAEAKHSVENHMQLRTLPKGAQKIDAANFHELSRIVNGPKGLRIHAILDWCERHPEDLGDEEIQALLESTILSSTTLQNTLRAEPQVREDLRRLVEKNRLKYSEEWKTSAFWIRLGYCLETHFAQIGDEDVSRQIQLLHQQLDQLGKEPTLSEEDRALLDLQHVFMMGHLPVGELTDEQLNELATLWVKSIAFPAAHPSPPWIQREAEMICLKHLHQLDGLLQSTEARNTVFTCLQKLGPSEENWSGTYPEYTNGSLRISLATRRVYKNDLLLGKEWPREFQDHETLRRIFKTTPQAFIHANRLQTADGQYDCTLQDGEAIVLKIMHDKPYRLLSEQEAVEYGFPELLFKSGYTAWIEWNSITEKPENDHVVVMDAEGHSFAERNNNQIKACDQDGRAQDRYLVPWEKLSVEAKDFFNQIVNPHRALFWAVNGAVQRVDYPEAELSFVIREGKMHCLAFPNFVLSDRQGQALSGLSGAIGLKTPEGKSRVLLPAYDFSKERNHRSFLLRKPDGVGRYFLYEYDAEEAQLRPLDDTAALYIAYLYVKRGDYVEAFHYLDQMNPLKPLNQECWLLIRTLGEERSSHAPLANTFFLRLAYMVAEHDRLHGARKSGELQEAKNGEWILAFWADVAQRYQRWADKKTERSQKVPHAIQVTPHHQVRILEGIQKNLGLLAPALKRHYTRWILQEPVSIQLTDPSFELKGFRGGEPPENCQSPNQQIYGVAPEGSIKKHFWYYYSQLRINSLDEVMKFAMITDCHPADRPYLALLRIIQQNYEKFPCIKPNKYDWEAVTKKGQELASNNANLQPRTLELPAGNREIENRPILPVKQIPMPKELYSEWPLQGLCSAHFSEQKQKVVPNPFALGDMIPEPGIEELLLNNLKTAHGLNQDREIPHYPLKTQPQELENEIQQTLRQDLERVNRLRSEIEELANRGNDDWQLQLKQALGLKERMTLKTLFPYYQIQKMERLTELNPNLSEDDTETLSQKLTEYLVLRSRIDQLSEAQKRLSENGSIQEVAEILHKRRHYDPEKFPYLLIYEYATGRFLRPRQVEILQWIFSKRDPEKTKQLLFEFEAGGGKTKVVAAILIFQLIEEGRLPIFFSIPELSDITKEDLRDALSQTYQTKLFPLELQLHHKLDADQLEQIYDDLNSWQQQKCCCFMIPESYHSLWLQYRLALDKGEEDKVFWLGKILFECLQKFGVFLLDEGNRTADALWQAIIAIGDPDSLLPDEQALYVALYNWLSQQPDLRLVKNGQVSTTAETRQKIYENLAEHLLNYLHIPESKKDGIRRFWFDATLAFPEANTFTEREIELISLSRGILTEILPLAFDMEVHLDYDRSLKAGDLTVSPRKNKNPSLAQYQNTDMAAALTAQLYYQTGLQAGDIPHLINKLITRHEEEEEENGENTPTMQLFASWQTDPADILPLNCVSTQNPKHLEKLVKTIGSNRDAIDYFLKECAIDQLKIFPEQISSSYADLIDGGHEAIVFGATLGLEEQYLVTENKDEAEEYREDLKFQARVVERATDPRNSTMYWMDSCPQKELFEKVLEADPEAFSRVKGIANVGGWSSELSTEEWATEFLQFNKDKDLKFKGVIFINERSSTQEISTPHLLLQTDTGIKRYQLDGSDVKASLIQLGLDPDLKLFKIYGPSQTTGTDLPMEPDAEMLILLGEGITFYNVVQALTRSRQFLKDSPDLSQGQGVRWIGPNQMKPLMEPDTEGNYSVCSVFAYSIKGQGRKLKETIRARCSLGLQHIVRNTVDDHLKKHLDNPKTQISIFTGHRKAFITDTKRNNSELYGQAISKEENAETVLQSMYQNNLATAELRKEDVTEQRGKQVEKILQQAKNLLPNLPAHQGAEPKGEMTQHVENVSQITARNIPAVWGYRVGLQLDKNNISEDKDYSNSWLSLIKKDFFSSEKEYYKIPANKLFECNIFSPFSFYFRNAITIATAGNFRTQLDDLEAGKRYLKPPMWYLIVEEGENRLFAAISAEDADNYRNQIPRVEGSRKAALITSSGRVVVQKGFAEDLLKAPWIRDEWIKFGVARGNNLRPKLLERLLKGQPTVSEEMPTLLNKVRTIHADPQAIAVDSLYRSIRESNPSALKNICAPPVKAEQKKDQNPPKWPSYTKRQEAKREPMKTFSLPPPPNIAPEPIIEEVKKEVKEELIVSPPPAELLTSSVSQLKSSEPSSEPLQATPPPKVEPQAPPLIVEPVPIPKQQPPRKSWLRTIFSAGGTALRFTWWVTKWPLVTIWKVFKWAIGWK